MITPRERFVQTLDFRPVDPPFVRPGLGMWQETHDLWLRQGWDGRSLEDVFGTDRLERVEVYYGPAPDFAYELVSEDATTRTFINHEGILMREFKEHRDTSMPQFLRFPVENETDFERLAADRLGLNPEARFTPEWAQRVQALAATCWPRQCWADRWGGYFGPLRNLMGLEGLCLAFYDQPRLIDRMMAQRTESILAITERILEHTAFETFWFWEDMAYNGGSLIDPRLFRRFALPHYRRVCDWLRARGIRHIWLDSDGDITELIPLWLEAGITGLWPFEVAAGMDIVQVRRQYGHDLALSGGIDKRAVAQGGQAMQQAVDHVMPLVEDGGYLPEMDHTAPPDISWGRFCEYMEYLMHRLGRG